MHASKKYSNRPPPDSAASGAACGRDASIPDVAQSGDNDISGLRPAYVAASQRARGAESC